VHALQRMASAQRAGISLPEGIPAAAGIVNLRYKSCPEMEGQDQFQVLIRSEGLAQYSPDGIIHHHRQGLQCWYALYSSPPGGTIHESWWDRTITLKT
ncbi:MULTISPECIES: hypothetical protein, partial [Klebsiella]